MFPKNFGFAFLIAVFAPSALLAQQVAITPVAITPVVISVKDPSGAGVPHALVRVVPAPDPTLKLETDSNGIVSLNLKPGGFIRAATLQLRRIGKKFS